MNSPIPDKSAKAAKHAREGKKNRELTAEIEALRADVDALKTAVSARGTPGITETPSPERAALEAALRDRLEAPTDAALLYAFALCTEGVNSETVVGSHQAGGMATFMAPSDERIARIGYALSSVPKVSLLRLLLSQGTQSAAHLGEQAGLSTGSLYHHLRELVHSGAIRQTGRSLYALTPLGQHLTVLVFGLAGSITE